MTEDNSLIKNILSVISTRMLLKGVNFLSLYLLLKYFSPEQLGQYGLFMSTLVLATTIGNLGLRNSVAREIGNTKLIDKNVKALVFAYPLLMIASTFVMLVTLYLSDFNFSSPTIIIAILMAVICHLIIVLRQGVCLGTGEIRLFNLLELVPRLVLLSLILITVFGLATAIQDIAIIGLTAGYIFTAIYAIRRTDINLSLLIDKQVQHLIKTGFLFCLALSLILLNTRIPLYITNILFDTAEAGQVFAALRVNDIFLELATAAGLVLFSHSTRSKNIDLPKMLKTIAGVFIATVFIAIGTILFAQELIVFISGEQYKIAATYLAIATLGLPFAAFNKMAYGVISGNGRPILGVYIYCIAIIFNLIFALILHQYNIQHFVLYALVTSQLVASLLFLKIIFGLSKQQATEI